MTYLDRNTGVPSDDTRAEILQNLTTILTTPIGSRVMRRDFGSELYELVDSNIDTVSRLKIYGATYSAIAQWEPRVQLQHVTIAAMGADVKIGKMTLTLQFRILTTGAIETLDVSL